MPTYQYRCTSCDDLIEARQNFTDAPLTVCPHCEGELRKVFNAVGVVFKGSGFYATDSRTTSSTAPAAPTTETTAAAKPTPAASSTASAASD